jgi:hypothetical protein
MSQRTYLYLQEVLRRAIDLLEALLASFWHSLHGCCRGRRCASKMSGEIAAILYWMLKNVTVNKSCSSALGECESVMWWGEEDRKVPLVEV